MIGPFILVIGLLLMWGVVRGKSPGILAALGQGQLPTNVGNTVSGALKAYIFDPLGNMLNGILPGIFMGIEQQAVSQAQSADSNDSSGGGSSGGSGSTDSGTHMGIDAAGNIITINSTIANMTAVEKDQANAFGRLFPGGSTSTSGPASQAFGIPAT